MHLSSLLPSICLLLAAVDARRSWAHVNKDERSSPAMQKRQEFMEMGSRGEFPRKAKRAESSFANRFLNNATAKFAVDGANIPDLTFDVGPSFAGLLPITPNATDGDSLYYWFWPSDNPESEKEILIWLNGGPGCSSLEGILQENGPFLWQYGTFQPISNPYSWTNLTNVVWVEQPVGTGFSQGKPTATNENEVASQFMGFFQNFVNTFSMQGYKVFITGESYAGYYVPYIADAMLNANDTTFFNLEATMIHDPSTSYDAIQEQIPALPFAKYFPDLIPFNDTFMSALEKQAETCGYTAYQDEFLVFPPAGIQPGPDKLPGVNSKGETTDDCDIWDGILNAVSLIQPCFDIYQIATTCPLLWDVLGFPGTFGYTPVGADIYFNRSDVQKAINAPQMEWTECANGVLDRDTSPPSGVSVLPGVIERSARTIIAHGALDYILIANGTLLMIQNMTWNGALGFQEKPTDAFFVPYHDDPQLGTIAGAGVLGTTHTERGLTYVGVDLSGHMIPQYAPSASYRTVEFLLGRIPSLTAETAFTTDPFPQPGPNVLGNGTAPPIKMKKGKRGMMPSWA